jgi:hypothetical protein
MGLGAGLFAKTFDSGYPSVASQLGLVVGLLVLLRPTSTRGKHHTTGFILAFFSVLLIHPTGAIYLGMLMFAHLIIGWSLDEKYGANIKKLLLTSSILLTLTGVVALLVLAPRMLDAAVFAEYGWQGGRPMLMYNGILLILGLTSAWKMRQSIEGRLLTVWFTGLWVLTGIHMIDGDGTIKQMGQRIRHRTIRICWFGRGHHCTVRRYVFRIIDIALDPRIASMNAGWIAT